ncbi:putative golgin subfamily A member 6-like protein 19 [Procambarus clarkii]|uniref:putative golgin subfamily A member 6-like protein 19 n=1 Tax=Procambarus clarkii TaxID=6728 RepID=UPI003743058D
MAHSSMSNMLYVSLASQSIYSVLTQPNPLSVIPSNVAILSKWSKKASASRGSKLQRSSGYYWIPHLLPRSLRVLATLVGAWDDSTGDGPLWDGSSWHGSTPIVSSRAMYCAMISYPMFRYLSRPHSDPKLLPLVGAELGVKERENATRRLLDTLDQLECVNKAHQADNLKLEEENTRLNTANHLLEEDNRKTKNEGQLAQEEIVLLKSQIRQVEEDSRLVKEEIRQVEEDSRLVKEEIRKVEEDSRLVKEDNMKTKNEVRLAQEENIQLKSQIRQVEEDSRLVKQEIRQVEEDSRLVKQEIRQVEEDSRLVKSRNQQLELAETQAQERVKTALTRIAELERETQQLQEMNNNTAREKGLVQEQLSLLEEQVRVLQTANAALNEEKEETIRKTKEEKRLVEEQLSVSEEEASKLREGNTALQSDKDRQAQQLRSTQEEHEKCKRNVSELYTRETTPKDCADLYRRGERLDGVYFIKPDR